MQPVLFVRDVYRGDLLNRVLREEKKYLINTADYVSLSGKLEKIMMCDPHNGVNGYTVRSLYFDTPFDDDFFEKQAGVELRRKVRLRCYNQSGDFAMLELKQKQGEYQLKRSLKVSVPDAKRLIAGDFAPLLSYAEPFAAEMYGLMTCRCYRPKAIVEYNRKAYIAQGNRIRITFDNRIVSTESSFELFDNGLNMNPTVSLFDTLLEVKYNGFLLGYIKDLIGCVDRSELAISKYCLARHNAYQTHI